MTLRNPRNSKVIGLGGPPQTSVSTTDRRQGSFFRCQHHRKDTWTSHASRPVNSICTCTAAPPSNPPSSHGKHSTLAAGAAHHAAPCPPLTTCGWRKHSPLAAVRAAASSSGQPRAPATRATASRVAAVALAASAQSDSTRILSTGTARIAARRASCALVPGLLSQLGSDHRKPRSPISRSSSRGTAQRAEFAWAC